MFTKHIYCISKRNALEQPFLKMVLPQELIILSAASMLGMEQTSGRKKLIQREFSASRGYSEITLR